jgi:asparagine synthase (glutamine-hydrolysing)
MCGISLAFGDMTAKSAIDALERMHACIAHRGPDGEGWLAVDADFQAISAATCARLREAVGNRRVRLAAAFRWLHVQDLDPASAQPMASSDGRHWLLFNGEIYNHDALGRDLRAVGRTFRTRSDTEAFLGAYGAWGVDAFARLNGMWAAAIVDLQTRRLIISRDRFGIRPMFYSLDGGVLRCVSEAKQILAARDATRASVPALAAYLAGQRIAPTQTFFEGLDAVPPASVAVLPLDSGPPATPAFRSYWRAAVNREQTPRDRAHASQAFEALLEEAVTLQGIAAKPVGALLSGGLDSSMVSSLLVGSRRQRGNPTGLVSVTVEDAGPHDERPYMRAMARHLAGPDVEAIEAPLDAAWLAGALDRITWHQEEPLAGSAVAAQNRAYEAAAAVGLRVVLEGTGSDEILAGYPRHQWAALCGSSRLRAVRSVAPLLARDAAFRAWWLGTVAATFKRRLRPATSARPTWLLADPPAAPALPRTAGAHSRLAAITMADLTWGNVPAVLAIGDRSAMAHSVESRVPFLDHRVVEFALRVPDAWKVADSETKTLLRDVARRRLPAAVATRRARIGFGLPIAKWLRGPLMPHVRDAAASPALHATGLIDRPALDRIVSSFSAGRDMHAAAVWRILAISRWLRVYNVRT